MTHPARRVGVATLLAVALVAGASAVVSTSADETVFAPPTDGFDRATVTVQVAPNGSSTVRIAYARPLENDTAIAAFRSAEGVETVRRTVRLANRTAAARSNRTDRRVTATLLEARSRVTAGSLGTEGVRTITIRMDGLATRTDAGVVLDLGGPIALTDRHRLVVEAGSGLAIDGRANESTRTVVGPQTLNDTTIEFVTVRAAGAAEGLPWLPAFAVLGLAVAFAAAGWLVAGRFRGPGGGAEETADPEAGGPPPEDLPDERRVERLLEAADGRMKQSAIVEATGWSKSKTSMVLSEMAEAGLIVKLPIGRENVISLPDALPDAVEPTDERVDSDDG